MWQSIMKEAIKCPQDIILPKDAEIYIYKFYKNNNQASTAYMTKKWNASLHSTFCYYFI